MPPRYVPDAGDVVWLNFTPQAGHEQAGHRPALVLSPAAYNGRTSLMLCCPLTTQIKNYPFEVHWRYAAKRRAGGSGEEPGLAQPRGEAQGPRDARTTGRSAREDTRAHRITCALPTFQPLPTRAPPVNLPLSLRFFEPQVSLDKEEVNARFRSLPLLCDDEPSQCGGRTGRPHLKLWRHWDRKLPNNSFVRRQLEANRLP